LKETGCVNTNIPPEELYTSLAAGIIDGLEWGGPACGWDMGWHEVTNYVVMKPAMFPTVTWHMVMSPETWESLDESLQSAVMMAARNNMQYMRTCYEYRNISKLEIMQRDFGLQAIYLSDEEVEQMYGWCVQVIQDIMQRDDTCYEAGSRMLDWMEFLGKI